MGSLRQQALDRMLAERLVRHGGRALLVGLNSRRMVEVRATDGPTLDVVITELELDPVFTEEPAPLIIFEEMDPR